MPASHLRKPFDPKQLRRIAGEMEQRRLSLGADVVVVRGLSGTLVASAMSVLFETPIAVVRKPNEKSHGYDIEAVDYKQVGEYDEQPVSYHNWIIIDDLIASGATVSAILEAVKSQGEKFTGSCKGILLYNNDYAECDIHVARYDHTRLPVWHIGKVL